MSIFKDSHLDKEISKIVIEANKKEREDHISSGKLSASILGFPLQWQVLKVIGIEKEFDEYLLRKFKRGHDVEEWIVDKMPNLLEKQKEVEYRGVVGFADAVVDSKDFDLQKGKMCHEIKSVANMKFKRIVKANEPDRSHKLQATLYSLALGYDYSAIDYVASDDYRIITFVFPVTDCKDDIDQIIDTFDKQIKSGIVPEFVEKESWQKLPDYNQYYDFATLSEKQIDEKLKTEYAEQYKKLKEYK